MPVAGGHQARKSTGAGSAPRITSEVAKIVRNAPAKEALA
jgi:hypothetical protein